MKIFISYSRADKATVDDLVPLLQHAHPNHVIWYDDQIMGGEDWWQRILIEISACSIFIYLLSNDSIDSEYCQKECREALRLKKPILPVIVRPKTDIEALPDQLKSEIKSRNWIDLSKTAKDTDAMSRLYGAIGTSLAQFPIESSVAVDTKSFARPNNQKIPISGVSARLITIIGLLILAVIIVVLVFQLLAQFGKAQISFPTSTNIASSIAANVYYTSVPRNKIAVTSPPTQTYINSVIPTVTANQQWTPQVRSSGEVDMMLVPPGCFTIGSNDAQTANLSDDTSNEKPQVHVCFDKPFWIDKFPVWQGQFKKLNGVATGASHFSGDWLPVEQITWFEANIYCTKNRGGRLPTEAEWEYAARGPDDLIYSYANSYDFSQSISEDMSNNQTAIVNRTDHNAASWVGATDMGGNVWQWTNSVYRPYPYIKSDGREDNNDISSARTLRGGSWNNSAFNLRSAARKGELPTSSSSNQGFRCARDY